MEDLKISFYSPLKAKGSIVPSGDREISRGLSQFFNENGSKILSVAEFDGRRAKFFKNKKISFLAPFKLLHCWLDVLKEKPDIFFTYHVYYKAPDWVHPILSFITGKPYVIYEGSFKPSLKKSDPFSYALMAFTLKQASLILTSTKQDFEVLSKHFPDKTHYIKPALKMDGENADFQCKNESSEYEKISLVSIAMLRPKKKFPSVSWLVEVLSELQQEGLEFEYHHIGGGEMLSALKEKCESLLKPQSFFLHGTLERPEITQILNMSDVFVYPGLGESFGMVYLEAQNSGLPVVAFEDGGITEAVKDGHSGFLSPVFDKTQFKKNVTKLVQDRTLRSKMSCNAREYVRQEHDQAKNYLRILNLINNELTPRQLTS